MDLQLPGIDGTEALRRLRHGVLGRRRTRRRGHAPARCARTTRAARTAGFDGFLEKPISVRALPGQVGRSCSGGGPMNDRAVTVLAVDDQPPNLRLLDAVLSPRGYNVVLCRLRCRRRCACSLTTRRSTWCCSTS